MQVSEVTVAREFALEFDNASYGVRRSKGIGKQWTMAYYASKIRYFIRVVKLN